LANIDPSNMKGLLFRQIELNWINAPLEDENDYIGLYLDGKPDSSALPVSVHKLNGQTSGQIISDFYLPQIDFYNDTIGTVEHPDEMALDGGNLVRDRSGSMEGLNVYERDNHSSPDQVQTKLNQFKMRELDKELPLTKPVMNDECIGYCLAYHSRHRILAKNCLRTNPNWMHDSFQLIGTRSLPSLMVPGSHNSATYPKKLDKTALHIVNKYQMNQDESIFNQLIYGIRHLDLRVGYCEVKQQSDRFWIYHDIFRTDVSLREVLDQVKRFLDLTTHEIVIMDFHRFTVGFQHENMAVQKERHSKLIDMIFKLLGRYIVPSYLGQHAPLNEYVAMGRRLMIGYASRASLLGLQNDQQSLFGLQIVQKEQPVRDIDAIKQDQDEQGESLGRQQLPQETLNQSQESSIGWHAGARLMDKIKSMKMLASSLSKRTSYRKQNQNQNSSRASLKIMQSGADDASSNESTRGYQELVARVSLFFPPIRHLWPNKDTIEGLAAYMNETTCRKYFGELRSMMAELTPTVFGAISDKYDGNRKLAQQVNRPVTDWIRDRWLHCVNIVTTDYFLGNDLIELSIYSNRMRILRRDSYLTYAGECKSFRPIEHLLDKSKIPLQFTYHQPATLSDSDLPTIGDTANDIITHTSSNGNRILLRPITSSFYDGKSMQRERRDSFVENFSEGFTSLFSSVKRFLNL